MREKGVRSFYSSGREVAQMTEGSNFQREGEYRREKKAALFGRGTDDEGGERSSFKFA